MIHEPHFTTVTKGNAVVDMKDTSQAQMQVPCGQYHRQSQAEIKTACTPSLLHKPASPAAS